MQRYQIPYAHMDPEDAATEDAPGTYVHVPSLMAFLTHQAMLSTPETEYVLIGMRDALAGAAARYNEARELQRRSRGN